MLNIDKKIEIKESFVIVIDYKIEGVSIEVVVFVFPIRIIVIISQAEIDKILGYFCRANGFTFTEVICTWQ